jgi:hypothetical protein
MRSLLLTAALAVAFAQVPALAAEPAEPAAPVDAQTLAAVTAVATKGYAHPEAAEVRSVTKSRARNGMGYCGEVSVEGSEGTFTAFHALLETANGTSVIRLSDYPEAEDDPQTVAVLRLLTNFGCRE